MVRPIEFQGLNYDFYQPVAYIYIYIYIYSRIDEHVGNRRKLIVCLTMYRVSPNPAKGMRFVATSSKMSLPCP